MEETKTIKLAEINQNKPKHAGGRPRKYKSVRAMKVAIGKYFVKVDDGEIPTKAGLTLHLGFVSKVSLQDYRNDFPEFTALLDHTFTLLEAWWEQRLAGSQCSGATFWLKNNAGYQDKTTIINEQPAIVHDNEKGAIDESCRVYKLKMSEGA